MKTLEKEIFEINNENDFNTVCLKIFKFQYSKNNIYKRYIDEININTSRINDYKKIPFFPIEFFKSHKIYCENKDHDLLFRSSGTTGFNTSKHYVFKKSIYEQSFLKTFRQFYGNPKDYVFLALLPSYLERDDSSLVYMVKHLSEISNDEHNGFYLNNFKKLYDKLKILEKQKRKTLLFGVSFALIDFFNTYNIKLKSTIIIETGGMKGRKKEMTREELHCFIKDASQSDNVNSEYGMTELLSQAYSKKENVFSCPNWMKVLIRDTNDPFTLYETGKVGGINIIDLANLYSCSFIETKDLGKIIDDNKFEILGRFDHSDIRGCNLLTI